MPRQMAYRYTGPATRHLQSQEDQERFGQ